MKNGVDSRFTDGLREWRERKGESNAEGREKAVSFAREEEGRLLEKRARKGKRKKSCRFFDFLLFQRRKGFRRFHLEKKGGEKEEKKTPLY